MKDYKMPSHTIFNYPGDEGTCEGKDKQAEGAVNRDLPFDSTREHAETPGQEGSISMPVNDPSYRQGFTEGLQHNEELGLFQKGPEVRATYIKPAVDANPYDAMPGAK